MGNTPSYFLGQFQLSPMPLPSARMTSEILSQLPILQLKDFPLFVHNCEHLSSGEFDLDVFMPRGGRITILDGIISLAQTVIEKDMGGKYTIERLRLSAEQMQWLKDRQGTVYESSRRKEFLTQATMLKETNKQVEEYIQRIMDFHSDT